MKNDNASAPNGSIRAFDARTGEYILSFDPIPRNPNDPQAQNWTEEALAKTGGGNSWSLLSVDQERDEAHAQDVGGDAQGGVRADEAVLGRAAEGAGQDEVASGSWPTRQWAADDLCQRSGNLGSSGDLPADRHLLGRRARIDPR